MPFHIIRGKPESVRADAIVRMEDPEERKTGPCESEKTVGNISIRKEEQTGTSGASCRYVLSTKKTLRQENSESGQGRSDSAAACRDSLRAAASLGLQSIAIPLAPSGDEKEANEADLSDVLDAIREAGEDCSDPMDVTLTVPVQGSFHISKELEKSVTTFLTEHGKAVPAERKHKAPGSRLFKRKDRGTRVSEDAADALTEQEDRRFSDAFFVQGLEEPRMDAARPEAMAASPGSLDQMIGHASEPFQKMLFHLIDRKGMTDPEVYKAAGIDRKLFSKIRCNENYVPAKNTVMSLAIGLKLNEDEAVDLMQRAGYAFSPSSRTDLIVLYCITHGIFDIYRVDALLFAYGEPTL